MEALTMRVHRCALCQATYSRATHLRRHEVIHSGERRFSCPFCNQRFFRVDIALRHSRSCANKGDQPLPNPRPRGRKRQACDACALAKRACNRQRPCKGCEVNGLSCAYYRGEDPKLPSSPQPETKSPIEPRDCSAEDLSFSDTDPQLLNDIIGEETGKMSNGIPIAFLLHFTDPDTDTIPHYFGPPAAGATCLKTSSVALHPDNNVDADVNMETEIPACIPDFQEYLEELMRPYNLPPFSEGWWCPTPDPQPTYCTEAYNQILQGRITKLIYHLTEAQNYVSGEKNQASLELLDTLFTVENVRTFVDAYFGYWHPHCPILHRPSFDSETVSLPLLLAVLLIGAVYSSSQEASLLRPLYDLAEEYVFEHEDFRQISETQHKNVSVSSTSSFEALQAAFLIAVIQNWGGTILSRRRMRIKRYSDIVSAARLMGLNSAYNCFYNEGKPNMDPFNWNKFIQDEARVRLMCYIFLVDSYYSIFYRYPPRIMVAEMSGDLPSHEETFATEDPAHCMSLAIEEQKLRPPSIVSCVELLMHNSPEVDYQTRCGTLTTLHLFAIISAFLSIIFISKVNCTGPYMIPQIRHGLARWKVLWDIHLPHVNSHSFIKNAHEFWQLANILVEEETAQIYSNMSKEHDLDSLKDLNTLLQRFTI